MLKYKIFNYILSSVNEDVREELRERISKAGIFIPLQGVSSLILASKGMDETSIDFWVYPHATYVYDNKGCILYFFSSVLSEDEINTLKKLETMEELDIHMNLMGL